MNEIEEIPTIYAEELGGEAPTAPPRRLAPIRGDSRLKPTPLKLNPRRESWTENLDETPTPNEETTTNSAFIAARRNSALLNEESERRSSQSSSSPHPTTPESRKMEEPKPEGSFLSDRSDDVKSPTLSQSSKRTSTSGDFAAQIRHKIREQARSVVAKKRGSVQLARRLSRQQTQTTNDEYTVDQEEEIDVEIESSIALGDKYTASNDLVTTHEQNQFFTGSISTNEFEDRNPEKMENKQRSLVHFVKAAPTSVSQRLLQNSQLRIYTKNPDFDETRLGSDESSLLVARPQREWNHAKQRFGVDFVDSCGFLKGTELMTTKLPLRFERDAGIEHQFLRRDGYVRWGGSTNDRKNLHQLDLRIEKIIFSRHWLMTEEDALAIDLRGLHEIQKATGESVIRLLKDFLSHKKRVYGTSDAEAKNLLQETVDRIWRELETEQLNYANLGEAIEAKWTELTALRETNETATTTLNLEKTYLKLDGLSEMTSEMEQLFYRTPVYKLTETFPLPEERPLSEKQRQEAIQGTHLLVQIHFNNIPVCKTKTRTIGADFTVEFCQSYNLNVHDAPNTITLTILERSRTTEYREIVKVGVPLPDQNQLTSGSVPLDAMEFAANRPFPKMKTAVGTTSTKSVCGKLFCSATWAEKGILSIHEKKEQIYSQGRGTYEYDGFHLIPKETRIVSDEEFRSDLRIEALIARSEGRLKGAKALRIPMHSAEIDPQLLFDADSRVTGNGGHRWQLAIDATREAGRKRAVQIRKHLKDRLSKDQRSIRYEDIVREEPIPTIFGAFGSLFGQADTSRKLRPMRKEPVTFQPTIHADNVRIVLNIQSALNLPTRADSSEIQSFVQVAWRSDSVQTTVAKGSNPSWNETLKINVPKANWGEVDEEILFNVYDQRVTPLDSDDREVNTVHEQLSHEWIGSLEVPFYTLVSMGKFEGTMRLRTPILSTNHRANQKAVYLKVLVAFDLKVPVSPSHGEPFAPAEAAEPATTLSQCSTWQRESTEGTPSRRLVATVSDSVGRSTLLCRFLRAIRPPPCVEQLAGNPERSAILAARIVGSISKICSPTVFPLTANVVVSADQLVLNGYGTALEKATLLSCWLMHLNLDPIVVVGRALPEGADCAFVIARVADIHLLLNPNDGFCYRLNDPLTPMLEVTTAVVCDNHFANLQMARHPSQLSWDLKNASLWRPLFPSPQKSELLSVQSAFLVYAPIAEDVLLELRASVEREIKVQFDESRRFGIPQWNLSAARTLREILSEFDARDALPPDLDTRLQYLRGSFHTTVVAFQIPYTSREDVLKAVTDTKLSQNANRNAQFAVAVHLSPFFGGVLRIAVALATLIPH